MKLIFSINNTNVDLTEFIDLLESGDAEAIAGCINKYAELVKPNEIALYEFLLWHAAKMGVRDAVALLLPKVVNINISMTGPDEDEEGLTPLAVAALKGHLGVVKLLVEQGADWKSAMAAGETPLFLAVLKGHTEVVKYFISLGADINFAMATGVEEGVTPLFQAVDLDYDDIVELLINHNADWTSALVAGRYKGYTPTFMAMLNSQSKVAELLVEKGANPNLPLEDGRNKGETLLIPAIRNSSLKAAKHLIKKGANIFFPIKKQENEEGETPLYIAADLGKDKMVELLLDAGGDNSYKLMPYSGKRALLRALVVSVADGYRNITNRLLAAIIKYDILEEIDLNSFKDKKISPENLNIFYSLLGERWYEALKQGANISPVKKRYRLLNSYNEKLSNTLQIYKLFSAKQYDELLSILSNGLEFTLNFTTGEGSLMHALISQYSRYKARPNKDQDGKQREGIKAVLMKLVEMKFDQSIGCKQCENLTPVELATQLNCHELVKEEQLAVDDSLLEKLRKTDVVFEKMDVDKSALPSNKIVPAKAATKFFTPGDKRSRDVDLAAPIPEKKAKTLELSTEGEVTDSDEEHAKTESPRHNR